MNNRSRWGEGLALCGLIIATPLVVLFGSAAAVSKLSFYWSCVLFAVSVSAVAWAVIFITRWFRRRADEKKKSESKSKNL